MIAMADWIHTYEVEHSRCNDFRAIVQFARGGYSNGYCNECPTPTGCTFEVRVQPPQQIKILQRWATLCGASPDDIEDADKAMRWIWRMEAAARVRPGEAQLSDITENGT